MPKVVNIDVEEVVDYILKTRQSIRETATYFGVSKSFIFSKIKTYEGNKKQELEAILQENVKKSRF